MNRDWQYLDNGTVPNPADAAHGPQLYDNHLYFNFGGVAAQDPVSYMKVICNYTGIIKATAIGNAPIVTGALHFPLSLRPPVTSALVNLKLLQFNYFMNVKL
jgi:hypothetical protein